MIRFSFSPSEPHSSFSNRIVVQLSHAVLAAGLFALSCGGTDAENGDSGGGSGDGDNVGVTDPNGCVPQCTGRECGDDSCGGLCGVCADGIACNPTTGMCAVLCGNGVVDAGETCDPPGSCPVTCADDGNACTSEALAGTAESCSATCVSTPIVECVAGDGCCPAGCNGVTDSDCDPVCGNGILEPGETCGDGGPACPTVCDDGDLCTEDLLVGSAATCDAACEHPAIDPCALDQARGVTVGDISVDQGIRIPVRESGALIPIENYNGDLIVNRPMLVRASWVLDDEATFETRQIRAVLTIKYADGSTQTVEDVKETGVRTEYTYDDFRDAYTFIVDAEYVQKGIGLSVELFEVDESFRMQPAPPVPARFPADPESTFELGVNTDPSHLEVVLVPLYHDLGANCPAAPDLFSMTSRGGEPMPEHEYYRQRLIAQNPVSDATIIVHDVVNFDGSAEVSGDIFTLLRQVRDADGADDWQFYSALIDPCDGGPGFSGVASVPGHGDDNLPDRNDGRRRTGWGRYRADGRHAGTFVHEIGHEQGRSHVGCENPAGPDPNYPNNTGNIDVYGWNVFSAEGIVEPDYKDYMSYCGPSWISEYAWNLMEPWIAEVSLWRATAPHSSVPMTPMLYATIQPGKAGDWWASEVRGEPGLDSSSHTISFYAGSTLLETQRAEYEEVHKQPGAYFLAAERPSDWSRVTHLVHSDGFSQELIERSSIRTVK